jgi:hypothetical protein
VDQRLAAGDRDHRRAALLDRADGLVDGHPPSELVLGVLDLAASGALQIALEEGLELDDQRKSLAASEFLLEQVGADAS